MNRSIPTPHQAKLLPHNIWLYVFGGAVLVLLVLPCLIVIPISFSASRYMEFPPKELAVVWYEEYFNSELWLLATGLSFKVAALVVIITVPVGYAAAYGIHHCRPAWSRTIHLVYLLPLIVPHIFIAIGVYLVFSKLGLNNTTVGLVLAHSLLALPFVVVTVLAGLQQFDYSMELAARGLGATRLRAILSVTMPQTRPHVMIGALLAFFTSFDEVLIAIFVSSGPQSTLPRRMFANIRDQVEPTVAAVSSLFILLTMTGLAITLLKIYRR